MDDDYEEESLRILREIRELMIQLVRMQEEALALVKEAQERAEEGD